MYNTAHSGSARGLQQAPAYFGLLGIAGRIPEGMTLERVGHGTLIWFVWPAQVWTMPTALSWPFDGTVPAVWRPLCKSASRRVYFFHTALGGFGGANGSACLRFGD